MTDDSSLRYRRNVLIPEVGAAGQARIRRSHACVVGLGGLGSPAAFYLAAAGVGTLTLVDPDVVDVSNLQRQILHTTERVGWAKVESARRSIAALNPDVQIRAVRERLDAVSSSRVIADADVVIEATDSFEAKLMINDACVGLGRPFATAGILGLSGQAMFVVPGATPCLRCVLPDVPGGVPTTSENGVLGAVPGVLGSVEALEALRWIAGVWHPRADGAGALHTVDGASMRLATISVHRRAECACRARWS